MGMELIEHVVVVMFENRSFDNLLGWLYDNDQNRPKFNIPTPAGGMTTFEGLSKDEFFNKLIVPGQETLGYAVQGTSACRSCPNPNQVPTPDPHEEFEHVTEQIFGKRDPGPEDTANMGGFLQNYSTTGAGL